VQSDRSIDQIMQALRESPDESTLSFSAKEVRGLLNLWKSAQGTAEGWKQLAGAPVSAETSSPPEFLKFWEVNADRLYDMEVEDIARISWKAGRAPVSAAEPVPSLLDELRAVKAPKDGVPAWKNHETGEAIPAADGQELPALPWPDSAELREWLRQNSAGAYRKAADAATYIEALERALAAAMSQSQGDMVEYLRGLLTRIASVSGEQTTTDLAVKGINAINLAAKQAGKEAP
jgi:hypothetical protein